MDYLIGIGLTIILLKLFIDLGKYIRLYFDVKNDNFYFKQRGLEISPETGEAIETSRPI